MPDDIPATVLTTETVAVGGSVTGDIENARDQDWFAVTLEAGKTYRIDLEGSPTNAGTLYDPYLRGVYDADTNRIADTTNNNGGTGRNSRIYFEPEADGTYYVAAGAYGSRTGTYRLSVAEENDDYPANTDTSGTVEVGGSVTGDIERARDQDWFAVTLEAGKTYRIDLEGSPTNAGTLQDPYLRGVYDADTNRIAGTMNDDGGTRLNSRIDFEPETNGTYYVAAGAYGSRTGTYRLSVAEENDDYPANTDTSGTVEVGGSVTGDIESPGDEDWFAVELKAGTQYRIDLEGESTGAGTLNDPYFLGVYGMRGDWISGTYDNDHGAGFNSRILFAPDADGTYYLAAGASGLGTGTYGLSVSEVSDDYPADTSTTGTVEVGGSAAGDIERPGDQDWFAVVLDAGKRYRIDLEGASNDAGTLSDPVLHGVYTATANLIGGTAVDDGGWGWNSRLFFEPDTDGTYYIAAGSHRVIWGDDTTGTYQVSVTEVEPDHSAGTDTTGTVEVDGSATGEIELSGDQDWFAVTLDAGKTYRIDLEGVYTNAGTLSNPYLRGVYDEYGDLIRDTSVDDGGVFLNSRLFFAPETGGTYYIAAGANQDLGTYRLSVMEVAEDDHPSDTSTSGTVAVGEPATGDLERPGDQDWFAVTLRAGTIYQIDLEGASTGEGTLSNPYIRGVHDTYGSLIAGTTADNGGAGLNSRINFEPATDGTYYIAAGTHNHLTGTYRVSVTPDDDYRADTSTSGTIAVDGSATGDIEDPFDEDWFAAELQAGTRYQIDLEGSPTNAGTLSDPYLRGVHDEGGILIPGTTNDDWGNSLNSRIYFEPDADGTYYIAAGAYGSSSGTYEVSVEEVL